MEYKVQKETDKKKYLELDNAVLKDEKEKIQENIKILKADKAEIE